MKKYISLVMLILWMIFIFIMSHTSAVSSSNQSGFIVNFINNILKIDNVELLETLIRKLAHLFEYFILGILMINYFKNYNIKNYILILVILCFIYACTDEIHQLFIPGRDGNIKDVFIDTFGSFIGIITYKYCNKYIKVIK